jgi:hypothetical protein
MHNIRPFNTEKSDYNLMDQNNGWNKELMDFRAKLTYIKVVMENNSQSSENIEEALSKLPFSDEERAIIKQQIHLYFTNRVTIS